jgi:hypothetical protein
MLQIKRKVRNDKSVLKPNAPFILNTRSIPTNSIVWGKFDGYFIGEGKFQFLFPGSEELSSAYDLKLFVNNTVKGSRMMAHRIELTSLNDIFFTDSFATTSYEKDGTMSFISKDPNRKLGKDLFRAYDGKLFK